MAPSFASDNRMYHGVMGLQTNPTQQKPRETQPTLNDTKRAWLALMDRVRCSHPAGSTVCGWRLAVEN